MKKLLYFILSLVIGVCFVTPNNVSIKAVEEEYQVNAPDWTEEQYIDYYTQSNIFPASPPNGNGNMLEYQGVNAHLSNKFSGYGSWSDSAAGSKSVSSVFGGNPIDTDENDPLIQQAKKNSKISGHDYIGCGPLALFTQLDYFARYAGYTQFASDPNLPYHKVMLATDIFNTVTTYPSNGFWASLFKAIGIEMEDGTFTFPHDFIFGAEKLFQSYGINTGIGPEDVNPDGSYLQHMMITGDTIPSLASHSTKINKLKSSIDKGMPVVWWTTGDAGDFSNHFMNIFGYEKWVGTNSTGQKKEHLMFKVRFNWGINDIYMDSDLINAVNGGFIFFEEKTDRIFINKEDYNFPQQYHYDRVDKDLLIDGNIVTTRRLRTGYINENGISGSGDWHLTMSARRVGAGTAYLEYNLQKPINFIYFDVSLWGSSEGINKTNSRAVLEYRDPTNSWVEAVNFFDSKQNMDGFSNSKDYPDKYRVDFPYGTKDFRFLVTAENPTNTTTNSGRVIIGTVGIVFDSHDTSDSNLYVTIYADNDGGSSSFNWSGHAWLEIYNNSPNPVLIGKYWIPAFEGITIGTYGNKKHTGLYYNLECYFYHNAAESSSSGSSGSSSGSSGGSSIVGYASGRVSLTIVIDVSLASAITPKVNANDEWNIFDNCTDFAIGVWNKVSDNDFSTEWISTPTNLLEQIEDEDNYQTNRNIYGNIKNVGYYSGSTFVHSTS